jgi:hypothetical protein
MNVTIDRLIGVIGNLYVQVQVLTDQLTEAQARIRAYEAKPQDGADAAPAQEVREQIRAEIP